jgi:hypothetical protein
LLVLALATAAAAPLARAGAQVAAPRLEPPFDATVRYLQEDQNDDGGFGGEPGEPSDPDFSSWVALALAAADINPHDQARPGGTDVYTYLAEHADELSATTDFERALLVVDASESPPRPLGGVDLVARLLERRLPDGAFTHEAGGTTPGMNDTIFAILALAPIEEPAIEGVVRAAGEWVIAEQDEDGSWPAWCPKSVCGWPGEDPEGSTDMTGAAIEALNAAGMRGTEAEARALAYLREAQLADGGWPQARGEGEANVGSSAWVVQGIWAAGQNPEDWRTGAGGTSEEPLDYLASMQGADGHLRYSASQDLNGVWMTSYATPALAGRALPIVPPPARVAPPAPGSEAGAGSGEGHGAAGVIAGGGGAGAPKFSRPKRGSRGTTPGGARLVRGQGLRARDGGRDRRGANRHQPAGTETAEPVGTAEADGEMRSVSPGTPRDHGGAPPSSTGSRRAGTPAPASAPSPRRAGSPAPGEEIDGTVIGLPRSAAGKLAFGAPGLRSAGGGGTGSGAALAIGAGVLLAALFGIGWERRRGVPA